MANDERVPRAGIYCRISDDRQGDGLGVERQRNDCRALAKRLGWEVVDLYEDNDVSAYSGKYRKHYERMLADLVSGRINAVITWHFDRINRSPLELERLIPILDGRKVQVQTVTAGTMDLTTPTGRAVARIVSAIAVMESGHKSDRIRAKYLQVALTGAPTQRGQHRGYDYAEDRVTVIPAEAKVIREMMRRFLAGEATPSICRDLNARGLTTPQGRRWMSGKVDMMLRSPRIAGWRQAPQHVGQARQTPEFLVLGQWPAIVPRRDVERAAAIMADPTVRPGSSSRWLMTGIAICGGCGYTLTAGDSGVDGVRYVCHSPSIPARRTGTHGHYAMLAEPLERIVTDQLVAEVRGGLIGRLLRLPVTEAALPALDEIALAAVDHAHAYGQITAEEKKRQRRRVFDASRANRAKAGQLLERRRLAEIGRAPTRFRATWAALELREQRGLLATCAESITVGRHFGPTGRANPDRIQIVWRA